MRPMKNKWALNRHEANKTAALAIIPPQDGSDIADLVTQAEQDLLTKPRAPVVQLVDRLLFQGVH